MIGPVTDKRLDQIVQTLITRDFEALWVPNKQRAREIILERVQPGGNVGVGGSMTIRELKVLDTLRERGHTIYDHWIPDAPKEEITKIRKLQMQSDIFLSGINALITDGRIVNIDGIGNRVNSMIFGPDRVILVAGINKIVETLDAAFYRIKNVASPPNARRLSLKTPCAKTGKCTDCRSPQRICRAVTILEWRPMLTEILVIIVNESLGF
jgi:L-lactate utilization protein LutB